MSQHDSTQPTNRQADEVPKPTPTPLATDDALQLENQQFGLRHAMVAAVLFSVLFLVMTWISRDWAETQRTALMILCIAQLGLLGLGVVLLARLERWSSSRLGPAIGYIRRPAFVQLKVIRFGIWAATLMVTGYSVFWWIVTAHYGPLDSLADSLGDLMQLWLLAVWLVLQIVLIDLIRRRGGGAIKLHEGGLMFELMPVPWNSMRNVHWIKRHENRLAIRFIHPWARTESKRIVLIDPIDLPAVGRCMRRTMEETAKRAAAANEEQNASGTA